VAGIFHNKKISLGSPVPIAPLVTFRIVFGLLMCVSMLRFVWRGWVTSVYIQPKFHFTYMGFDWVRPMGSTAMHLLFISLILATLFITIGLFYRLSAIVFFIGFTYVELLDVTTYLNHYYFISLVAFIMIWVPAASDYSADVLLKPSKRRKMVPLWCIGIIRFQMAIVYIFAGLAKVNADWLLDAQPLRTWLPGKSHLPIVGKYMYEEWVTYLFSWFGAVYDLLIVFFLLNKRTRPVAYAFVIIFHTATAIFFPGIGMFPYVMMTCSLVFFSSGFHEKLLSYIPFHAEKDTPAYVNPIPYQNVNSRPFYVAIWLYVLIQVTVPFRYILYPGHLFWHEEGFRFSWRVMLMEKSGAAYFTIKEKDTNRSFVVNNAEFLTNLQEKMMSTQPDMILKYAHFLAAEYKKRGVVDPGVYGEIYVSLNGKRSRLFIDSNVDLASQPVSWKHYSWVLPYDK
jgi:hypothetical protein